MSTSPTTTRTEHTSRWRSERLPVVKQRMGPKLAPELSQCQGSADCIIDTTLQPESWPGLFFMINENELRERCVSRALAGFESSFS
jgi:hypothetical protein